MTKEEDIWAAIVWFYESLYKNAEWMPHLDGLHFPSIDETDRGWLEREFDREDFLEVTRHQGLMSLLWLFSNSVGDIVTDITSCRLLLRIYVCTSVLFFIMKPSVH